MTKQEVNPLHTKIALASFRSVQSQFAYCSGPITSGIIAYNVFDEQKANSIEALQDKLGKDARYELIIKPNIEALKRFASEVKSRTKLPVVNPADFKVEEFEGNEYQYMDIWERFVEGCVDELHMINGWHYSTGGIMEIRRGFQTKKARLGESKQFEIYDHQGNVFEPANALCLVECAVNDVRNRGYTVGRLEKAYSDLEEVVKSS